MRGSISSSRKRRNGHGRRRCNVKLIVATTMAMTLTLTPLLAADNEPAKRLDDAAAVFSEIMAVVP